MKILYVIHDNKKGGAAHSFLSMIKLIKKENEVFVLTPHKNGFIPEELDKLGIPHDNAHYFWWMIATTNSKSRRVAKVIVYKLLQGITYIESIRVGYKLRKEGFDLVHSNSSVINFGALLARQMNIAHIWHIRELALEGMNFIPMFKPSNIYDFIEKNSTKIIAISKDVEERYSQFVDKAKIVCIYNGIENVMNYKKVEYPKKGEKIIFLIAGNYFREKGQLEVALAARKLIESGIDNFEVWMAGAGSFDSVLEIVENGYLQGNIKILGLVNNMLELRIKSHVEIVATKYEAFGRVTVEAMKASNPVIGTNAGGTKELIQDGINGYLFDYMDYEELAEKMKAFILYPELIEKMGEKAYESVEGRFTSEECVDKVMQEYEKIRMK